MENTERGTRKKYSKEFKLEAVRMLEAGERGGHLIEKDLGIDSDQVYRWRKEFTASGEQDEELVRLRKENASLHEDREILRKVVAMFSTPPR
jgi:transposase